MPRVFRVFGVATLGTFAMCALVSEAIAAGEVDPLFVGDEVLDVVIEAPFDRLIDERSETTDLDAVLRLTTPTGEVESFDIQLRARGEFRRQRRVCPFPPIRLDFDTKSVAGSLFAGQDKLKLVTHCRPTSMQYEQGVLKEYLAYRLFNLVTDNSYRVRLLRVTYRFTDKDQTYESYAFVIEHRDRLAARIGLPVLEVSNLKIESLDPAYTNLASVFQYMIGNTDFSPIRATPDETCCHNYSPFGAPGQPYLSIPYDFDMSGLVDADYAKPNPRFRLGSVRSRLYRGRCVNNGHLEANLALFREKRGAVRDLVESLEGMTSTSRKKSLTYLAGFYKVIDNPRYVNRSLLKRCI